MNNDILIYVKRDKNNSIIQVISSIFIQDTIGYEQVDKCADEQNRYVYAHADNGEYVMEKHGKPLFDEQGRPNFHDKFVAWTEVEKDKLYPIPKPEPSELEKLRMEQEVTAQAVQDLILMTMGGV